MAKAGRSPRACKGIEFTTCEHVAEALVRGHALGRHMRHVGVLRGISLPGGLDAAFHPADFREIDTIFLGEDATDPAGRALTVAERADPLAFEILRCADPGIAIDENVSVPEEA